MHTARSISGPTRRSFIAGLAGAGGVLAPPGSLAAQEADAGDVVVKIAVRYSEFDELALLLDVHSPPPHDIPRPAMIAIHPGGFVVDDRTWMSEFAWSLATTGYVTFSIDYRLFAASDKRTRWSGPLDDARRAVRWVRADAAGRGVDPERIGAETTPFVGLHRANDSINPIEHA